MSDYAPHVKEDFILNAAWQHIKSVDYQVSARWLFYRLLQDGYYSRKNDYKNRYIPLISRARKNYYQGWRPNTLVDEHRNATRRISGYSDVHEWAINYSRGGFGCELDHFYRQENYAMVIFEAVAMASQFEHYTSKIDLWPFGGMPSIDYKYRIAKEIEYKAQEYGKPVKVLYFGDYDRAGLIIPETSFADIEEWCNVEFEFIRCGLNPGDEVEYNIPENFEHPGAFQWEALDDHAAKEIITSAVNQYVDQNVIIKCEQEGEKAAQIFNQYVEGFYEYYLEEIGNEEIDNEEIDDDGQNHD